jgi:CRP/FNR family transcriptional regulator, cyclic AMP receptor protein
MDELLALAADASRRTLVAGEQLVVDGEPAGPLFVLITGTLQVRKSGVTVAVVTDPGACVREMSLLLGTPATADVVAVEDTTVAVLDDAAALLDREPDLALALARLLARRLQSMTTYLVDLKQQYADHQGGLGMVDVVLGNLMQGAGRGTELRSARDPDPEF